nr:PAS domain-containing protein [Rhizobium sullae]
MELETGHFFATEDVHAIFGLPYTTGPANLVELLSRIHDEDRILITQTFEHASRHKVGCHDVYRVDNRRGGYKMVQSVGRFRNNEIFGVAYEFVEPLRIVGVEDNSLQP